MRSRRTVKYKHRKVRPFGMHADHRGYESVGDYRHHQVKHGIAFVVITAGCFAATLASAPDVKWDLYLAGWALALACAALSWFRPSLWLLAPFGAFGGAILVRAGTDGLAAGLGPLLLIPVLAVAIYGSRRALLITILSVAATVLLIQVASTDSAIKLTPTWRQDLVLALIAIVLAVVIHDLVTRMRRERNLAEERGRIIEELALTDPLTGIDNRRGWERALRRALGQARRHSQPVSLAMLDLDGFKKYNDTFGHQAGDDFLRRAAQGWEERTRVEDHIARYGGEEFVLTLPNTDLVLARSLVERLRQDLPRTDGSEPSRVTCSAGVAEWDGSETVRELVARADQALYLAKEAGRDRTVSVDTPVGEDAGSVDGSAPAAGSDHEDGSVPEDPQLPPGVQSFDGP